MSDSVKSPCVKLCKLHEGICVGCGRTKEEIGQWSTMTTDQQQQVINRLTNKE